MRAPYVIGVWQRSIKDAMSFVNEYRLGDNLIQLVPDQEMKFAYWVMISVTGGQMQAFREMKVTPKLTVIP